ncbi:MAG: tRNA (adenosine(37)-N6)-threonylcarbamoyltransferase complex ATPase subunit type 1 TsaE [Saprospiraceae bacterium]|nr:tRNA (adenosine(37)-N6)-threonylcarbamoyltransferase complex ATPase subunit type 1 TsaE [Saprospiraceae bacterium]
MDKTFIYTLSGKDILAKSLLFQYAEFKKWAWYGDLGTGKTTLTKSCSKLLGSVDAGSSPTFSIVNQYQTIRHESIWHLDLYRLKNTEEAFQAGIYELIRGDDYYFVEWPELIEDWMDDSWLKLYIEALDDETRVIKVNSLSPGAIHHR